MSKAKVVFTKLIQDSQDFGSSDDHMVSRAFFTLKVENQKPVESHVDIKQTAGTNVDSEPLEVSKPHGYAGPYNHDVMSQLAENYYRALVGSQGSGIRISGGSNIRMRNNTFGQPSEPVEFEVSAGGPSW